MIVVVCVVVFCWVVGLLNEFFGISLFRLWCFFSVSCLSCFCICCWFGTCSFFVYVVVVCICLLPWP